MAPMMAPIDVPAITAGLMPSSSRASITGIWASPRAPPPPRASPIRGSLRLPLPPSAIDQDAGAPTRTTIRSLANRRFATRRTSSMVTAAIRPFRRST